MTDSQLVPLEEEALRERFETSACKTTEEIEKLAVREDLSEYDRVCFLLQSANPLQRSCGISAVVPLVEALQSAPPPPQPPQQPMSPKTPTTAGRGGPTTTTPSAPDLISRMIAAATPGPRTTRDHVVSAADALAQLLAKKWVGAAQAREAVLPLTTRIIKSAADADVLRDWGQVLFALFSAMPEPALHAAGVIQFVVSMGDPQNASPVRLLSCGAVGALARSAPTLAASLVEQALALSQDVDFEVRASMPAALDSLSRALGPSAAKKVVLPALLELLDDEAAVARQRAFEAVVGLVPFFDPQTQDHAVIPRLRAFCRDPPEDVVLTIATKFGQLLCNVQGMLATQDLLAMSHLFRQLAARRAPDVRRACAFNMPAVILALGAERFPADLKQIFIALSLDSAASVRRSIAAGFHEVVRLLSKQLSSHVRDVFFRLLQDSPEVVDPMIENIPTIARCFESESLVFQGAFFAALIESNDKLVASRDWRMHERLVWQFQNVFSFVPSPQIIEKLVPALLDIMAGNVRQFSSSPHHCR